MPVLKNRPTSEPVLTTFAKATAGRPIENPSIDNPSIGNLQSPIANQPPTRSPRA
jgi:hypothetical protein